MRLATVQLSPNAPPVAAVGAFDGTWIELAALTDRSAVPLAGALTWVEKKSLGDKRMLLVTGATAEARLRPEDAAPTVFAAAQNVVLELVEAASNGWLRVRHADGATGFVRAAQVWGD